VDASALRTVQSSASGIVTTGSARMTVRLDGEARGGDDVVRREREQSAPTARFAAESRHQAELDLEQVKAPEADRPQHPHETPARINVPEARQTYRHLRRHPESALLRRRPFIPSRVTRTAWSASA
jgi:hypothetical protein